MPDPIALERRLHWQARRARWRADRVSAVTLALVWCAVLAVGMALVWSLAQRHGAQLLALLAAQVPACALLVFAATLLDDERALLTASRQWRRGWLAGLAGLGRALPAQLTRVVLRRALVQSAIVLALPPLLAAASRQAPAGWPAAWWLVAAAPWLAAPLARALATRARDDHRATGAGQLPGATWILAGLPVVARWQWAAWARAQRGRAAAWLLLPLLLAVPAAMSPPGTLLALFAAFALGVLLTLWSAALACVPRAAALLRATPWRSRGFLAASLLLPGALLLLGAGLPGALLVGAAGWQGGLPVLFLVVLALLHAGVVVAERQRPRRIAPLLALQLALQAAVLQSLPPLAAPLLLVQLAMLARKALRG